MDGVVRGQVDGEASPAGEERVPLSQLLGSLSHALDLTEGQPHGHAARTCLIGMRIAREMGLSREQLSHLYYALILKDAGCSSNSHGTAAFFGTDDHELKRNLKTADWTHPWRSVLFALRNAGAGRGFPSRLRQIVSIARAEEGSAGELIRIRCERGAQICLSLGFPPATAEAVRGLDEHWDGRGEPEGLKGEAIPLLARVVSLAQTVEVFASRFGADEALEMARRRSGRWFDPALVKVLEGIASDRGWWARIYGGEVLRRLAEEEPAERVLTVDQDGVDRVAEAFAGVVDAKTPFTFRHSTRVARLARGMGEILSMGAEAARGLYRAGLLHDIGKLGISNRILDKEGPLTPEERTEVRRHPVLSWTILAQVEAFAPIARNASVHHERLDGGGYPWGYGEAELTLADRILCVADIYEALTASRPYRDAMPEDEAFRILEDLEGAALDGRVVDALRALEPGDRML